MYKNTILFEAQKSGNPFRLGGNPWKPIGNPFGNLGNPFGNPSTNPSRKPWQIITTAQDHVWKKAFWSKRDLTRVLQNRGGAVQVQVAGGPCEQASEPNAKPNSRLVILQ